MIKHLSHSALDDYRKCPWGFKLKRIDKVPQTKLLAGPAGTALHNMTQEYDELRKRDYRYGQYLFEIVEYDTEYTAIRGEDFLWWETNGQKMYNDYLKWRQKTEWEVKEVELAFEVTLPGLDLPFVGYVDRVFEMKSGRLVIVDIKTGYWVSDRNPQLKEYRAALVHDGMDVDATTYYNARKGDTTGIDYVPDYGPKELALDIQPIERAILAEDFKPNPSAANCNRCYVKQHCEFSKATVKSDD